MVWYNNSVCCKQCIVLYAENHEWERFTGTCVSVCVWVCLCVCVWLSLSVCISIYVSLSVSVHVWQLPSSPFVCRHNTWLDHGAVFCCWWFLPLLHHAGRTQYSTLDTTEISLLFVKLETWKRYIRHQVRILCTWLFLPHTKGNDTYNNRESSYTLFFI